MIFERDFRSLPDDFSVVLDRQESTNILGRLAGTGDREAVGCDISTWQHLAIANRLPSDMGRFIERQMLTNMLIVSLLSVSFDQD